MKILTTEATIWWVALHDEIRPVKVPPIGLIMDAIGKTFAFRVMPADLKFGQGLEFQNGALIQPDGPPISISKIVAYNDGFNIVVPSSTDDGDKVLDAVLGLFRIFGMREPTTPASHAYISHVVVDFDCSIDAFFPTSLLRELAGMLPMQGDIHALSVGLQFDPTKLERRVLGPTNAGFRIERREGFPYSQNRYFSASNMSTSQHAAFLERFEAAARKAGG